MASPMYVWDGGNDADGLSWATAYQDILDGLINTDAGGVLYTASKHSQTQAVALTLGSTNGTLANPVTIISVDKDNSDAYLAMRDDVAPGKIECTGAASNMIFSNSDIYIGLTFNVGNDLVMSATGKQFSMIDCKFAVADNMSVGGTAGDTAVYWENCIFEQVTAGYWIVTYNAKFTWRGGQFSFNGGSIATRLLYSATRDVNIMFSDIDFQDLDEIIEIIKNNI